MKSRRIGTILLLLIIALAAVPAPAAVWSRLARSDRYDVSVDVSSIIPLDSSRVAVLLRFNPIGERQRQLAATDYNIKGYRWHVEYFEIDCAQSSAVMGYTDILGDKGKLLSHTRGDGAFEPVMPGTILEKAMDTACPDQNDLESGETASDSSPQPGNESLAEQAELAAKIDEARKRVISEPASHDAWTGLGNALYDAGKPEEAISAYGRSLDIKPGDPIVLNNLGAMHHMAGNSEKAMEIFNKVLIINPANLDSLYNMGYIYAYDLNRSDKAIEIWTKYLALDSTSETAGQIRTYLEKHAEKQ